MVRLSLLRLLVIQACVAGLLASAVAAQPAPGSLSGLVSAVNGGTLPGTTITVRGNQGTERVVTTREDGEYLVEALPVGEVYTVRADIDGFATVTQTGVTVVSGGATRVSFLLLPGATESLSVTARAVSAPQPGATLDHTVSDRLTHALPLFGRDFIALVSLTPGVVGNPSAPSTNGQISWTNNVLVDGSSHYSKWRSAPRAFYSGYPLEAVQDVQVLTAQFAPEYGEGLSSVTMGRTRSGSNTRHGSVLLFGQAGALNDQPVFASRKPAAASLRFGATLGGPVTAGRTFFFGSYEGRRARGKNIVSSPVAPQAEVDNNEDEHLGLFKLDHRLSANDVVTVRYTGQWFEWKNENGGLWVPGSGIDYRNDVHTAVVSATQFVSERLLNQARFQFARYSDLRTDLSPTLHVQRAGYSAEGATLGPYGFGATPEDTWEAADVMAWTLAAHAVKFGTGFRFTRAYNESLPYGRGAYFFAGPPSLFPEPYAFLQNVEVSSIGHIVEPRSVSSFGFVQDNWQVAPRLTAMLGVRYDIEQIRNVRGYTARADTNNIQPRASAVWNPVGRLAVRGGAGVYAQQHLLYYINRAQLEGPSGSAMVALTPASPFMPVYPATVGPEILTRIPRDVFAVAADFRNPYSLQASLGVQHPLFGFDVSADYVYLVGRDLMSIVDVNAPASAIKGLPRTVTQADLTRPQVPAPGGTRKIITLGNEGRSWYRALQVSAARGSGALHGLATYTLARTEDMANYQLPEDSRNIAAEKARADNDVRHNLTAGLVWQLPFSGRGLSGWSLSAAGQFRSNRPYTITWGDDRNGTTQNDARPGARNTARGPSYRSVDLSLTRRTPIGSRTLEVRAEAFNVLSAKNYEEYVGSLSSPLFGQPVSAFPRRRLQFAAIVRF